MLPFFQAGRRQLSPQGPADSRAPWQTDLAEALFGEKTITTTSIRPPPLPCLHQLGWSEQPWLQNVTPCGAGMALPPVSVLCPPSSCSQTRGDAAGQGVLGTLATPATQQRATGHCAWEVRSPRILSTTKAEPSSSSSSSPHEVLPGWQGTAEPRPTSWHPAAAAFSLPSGADGEQQSPSRGEVCSRCSPPSRHLHGEEGTQGLPRPTWTLLTPSPPGDVRSCLLPSQKTHP